MQRQIESAETTERAYIGATEIKIAGISQVGNRQSAYVIFLNGGRTPAWKIVANARLALDKPEPRTWTKSNSGLTQKLSGFFPPDSERKIDFPDLDFVIDGKTQGDILHGARKLFFYGELRCVDYFGKDRTFPFCYLYNHDIREWVDYPQSDHQAE